MSRALPKHWSRRRVVSSIFMNLERILERHAPKSAPILLGARWCFGLPRCLKRRNMCEYSFPLSPIAFPCALAERTGVVIESHTGADSKRLYDFLECADAAIIAVDSYFLPYRPAYLRVHSNRTVVIRRTATPSEVWVEDYWPPSYQGILSILDLERARYSPTQLVDDFEPVFAGHPIEGEWFSVEVKPVSMRDPCQWSLGILRLLVEEATTSLVDEHAHYGIAAICQLKDDLSKEISGPEDERRLALRQASLVLRAELSARVYLCALLEACAGWTSNVRLQCAVRIYSAALWHLEMARDITIKEIVRPCPLYRAYISDRLSSFIAAERRLIRILGDQIERAQSDSNFRPSNKNLNFSQGGIHA